MLDKGVIPKIENCVVEGDMGEEEMRYLAG